MDRLKNFLMGNFQVSEHEWELIEDCFQLSLYKKGDYFIRKDRICYRLGFIAEGVMRYTYFKDNDREITCHFAWENDFIGEPDSFFKHIPCILNLQAVTDCLITSFSFNDYRDIIKIFPRFKDIAREIELKTVKNILDQKTFLVDSDSISKYQYFAKNYPHILRRVPLGHVASFLDITQQSLSRLRKQLI